MIFLQLLINYNCRNMFNKALILLFSLSYGISINAQSIDLRFVVADNNDCNNNNSCYTIQVKGVNGADYLGTSSILFEYNANVIEFDGNQNGVNTGSFTPLNFDSLAVQQHCLMSNVSPFFDDISPYSQIHFDGTVQGLFLMTLNLTVATNNDVVFACPNIENIWTDVATICFETINAAGSPGLQFIGSDNGATSFNDDTHNPDLIYDNGTFTGFLESVDESCQQQGIELNLKAAIQGALLNSNSNLMRDDLRVKNLIPLTEPFTALDNFMHVGSGGGETISNSLLSVTGNNAIVDWVFIEIINGNNVLATKSALLTRNHQVISNTGETILNFENVPPGNYFVAIKHRNHFACMTANTITFNGNVNFLDFTDLNTNLWGNNGSVIIDGSFQALWTGNTNNDDQIIFQGANNDVGSIFFEVLLDPDNDESSTNFIRNAYSTNDLNLDGNVIYQGIGNDLNAIFFNVLSHPDNTQFQSNYIIVQQLP